MKDINTQIKKHEDAIAKLKAKKEELKNKIEWISCSEIFDKKNDYEISSKPLHFNKTWEEQKASLKKGEEIASYELLQAIRNTKKFPDSFTNFWVRVTPNPDKISEEDGSVAWFVANSSWADLICGWGPQFSNASLGVFVIRKKSRSKK